MAMAMVQKARPLIPMQEKPTTAAPDYETFQLLFRKADEISLPLSSPPLLDRIINTDHIVEGDSRRKAFTIRQSELEIFKTQTSRTILYPNSFTEEVRTIRIRTNKKQRCRYNLSGLQLPPYGHWESDIIWDDSSSSNTIVRGKGGWIYRSQDDDTTVSKNLRKVITATNSEIISGGWVEGIVWDNDTTLTLDISSDSTENSDESDEEEEEFQIFSGNQKCRKRTKCSSNYDYSENIPLVNTAETIDLYLPHHQEAIQAAELQRKQEEEKEKRTQPPPLPTSSSVQTQLSLSSSSVAPQQQPSSGSEGNTVKSAAYRQQQAREKNDRLTKLYAVGGLGPVSETASVSAAIIQEDPQIAQAAARRRRMNASTELEHSTLASRHFNCKVNLIPNELKYYHRPLGRGLQGNWNISFDSRKGKNKLSHRRGNIRQNLTNQIRTLNDLALLEGEFICVEYIEEHPNILMNVGMASKIINYYRQPPEDKSQPTISQEIDMVEGSQALHVPTALTSQSKRLPRHLSCLQQNSLSATSTSINSIDIPKLPEGITEVLESTDPFPFLGDIEPGAPPQPCFHTNLFRAPLFSHLAKPTDFLLVRNPQNKKCPHFVLRQLPVFFTCGQQEPLQVVPKTGKKKTLSTFQSNFLLLHMTRYFVNQGTAVDPVVSHSNVSSEFEYFFKNYRNDARRYLARIAEDLGDGMWRRKPLKLITPVDEYESKFSPEEVCLQERAMCTDYQLRILGIEQALEPSKLQQGLHRMNKLIQNQKQRLDSIKEAAGLCVGTPKSTNLEILAQILDYHLKKIRADIAVGRFIYETIQLTPWVITESFVKGYLDKRGDAMLRLSGLGDPSGNREGFSLLRPTKSGGKAPGVQIYNTDKDLRKMTKKQLDDYLSPYYTPDQLKNITRWDKVDLVRKISNQAKEQNVGESFHKFARNEKPSHQNQLIAFKQSCQEIWKKQVDALSIEWQDIEFDDEYDDDDDDNEEQDDDDFADDFSDIEDENNVSAPKPAPSKSGKKKKGGGEDAKELQSLKTGEFYGSLGPNKTPTNSQPNFNATTEFQISSQAEKSWEPPKEVVKRITKRIKPDGTEIIEVRFIASEIDVKRVKAIKKPTANQGNSRQKNLALTPKFNDEEVFEPELSESHNIKLSIGAMKRKVEHAANQKAQLKALQELEEQRELSQYNMPQRKRDQSANRGKVTRNNRLPHVLFASTLEEIIVGIMKRKTALPFLHPVDVPDYLSKIRQPICLYDIRENIAKYKYSTVELFLDDLMLMTKNCEAYNGKDHPLTKDVKQIYTETVQLINIDRNNLGSEKDPFYVQQLDVRMKFQQLKRPLHSLTIPNLMLATNSTEAKKPQAALPPPPAQQLQFPEAEGFGAFDDDFGLDLDEDPNLLANNSPTINETPTPTMKSIPQEEVGESSGEEEVLEEGIL